jgi:hypothetical protein
MRLASFVTANLEPILLDWVAFARTQLSAAGNMDDAALRDHGKQVLAQACEPDAGASLD